MNQYLYNVTIFDTSPNPNLDVFPKVEPWTAIAESPDEAQRMIVEDLYDIEKGGTCAKYSTPEDPADRFHISFGEPQLADEVIYDETTGTWVWAEEH